MSLDVPPSSESRQAKLGPLVGASALIAIGLLLLAQLGETLMTPDWKWRQPSETLSPWFVNGMLLAAFGLQHSGMARDAWKRRFPARWNRAVYVFASGIGCGLLAGLWQRVPGDDWWDTSGWFIPLNVASIAVMVWCLLRMDVAGFLGWRPFLANTEVEERLDAAGLYRFVRHPLMLCTLVFLWTIPVMTATHGMLVVGLSSYILLGTVLEERDLSRRFGAEYLAYRSRVPMLLPWRWPL